MAERELAEEAIAEQSRPPETILRLEGVSKRYRGPGEVIDAAHDVSLSVHARELVALFGPSGSGKTTLLMLAAGLLAPDSGRVIFQGRDLGKLSRRQALAFRRTELGFIYQSFNLAAGLSAEENAALPLLLRGVGHRQARARARQTLTQVGLEHRVGHTPAQLSGGEQQRVAIARALVGDPKLILADEATGNLDSETGATVLELLATLPRQHGAAVILVTHDASAARHADRVLAMRDGRLSHVRERIER
jgi:putative ABC transport system ATP-binding protein